MKRRQILTGLGAGVATAALTACGSKTECSEQTSSAVKTINWNMVTTWPKNFQGLGEGAEYLAKLINEMSGGRLKIRIFGAGELVPALQVFDAVSSGSAQMGHGAAYYWRGKIPSASFFGAVPFGMNAQEMNSWLLKGDGLKLWTELYKPFGVVPRPCGNTGVQMAGWFNKELNSMDDIKGLKMRIPGLGGEVLKRAGGVPVLLPGSEVFSSLERGVLDAAEWVGPYNDLAFGLYKAAKYYYYPGWHEPGSTMEAIINQKALAELPDDLQQIVLNACLVANGDMLAEFNARNLEALNVLQQQHKVELRKIPDEILRELKRISVEVVKDSIADDEKGQEVYHSYHNFLAEVRNWTALSDQAFLAARDL